MTSLQLGSIPAMRGRVMALYSILFLGSTPLGGPLSGWLAQQFDTRVAIWMGAIAAIASGLVAVAALRRREPVLEGRLPTLAGAS